MITLKNVTDNLVTFEVNAGELLQQMIFNAVSLFAESYYAFAEINGKMISVLCPDSKTAEIIRNFELD